MKSLPYFFFKFLYILVIIQLAKSRKIQTNPHPNNTAVHNQMNNLKNNNNIFAQTNTNTNVSLAQTKDFFQQAVNNCNTVICKPQFATCQGLDTCLCKSGFANAPEVSKDKTICDYEQKKQQTAFFLEMFLIGVGHVYRGAIVLGTMKLLFVVLFPCFMLCLIFLGVLADEGIKAQSFIMITSLVVGGLYVLAVAIWYIYDLVLYGMNEYSDGNGIPLKAWNL